MRIDTIIKKSKELKRKKEYDKCYVGEISTIKLRKNLKNKLKEIRDGLDIFDTYNDIIAYFLFRFEEKRSVFHHQLRRYKEEISMIKDNSNLLCLKVDKLKQSRDLAKEQLLKSNADVKYLKRVLKAHEIKNVWTGRYGGGEDERSLDS